MTISLRIDEETVKQIEKIRKFYQNEIPFIGNVSKTDVIKFAIHSLFNDIYETDLMSNKMDTS